MKKRIICLTFVLIFCMMTLSSCFVGETKYDYDMTKYVNLANMTGPFDVERDYLQYVIDNNILQASATSTSNYYKAKAGDDIYVNIKFYELYYLKDEDGNLTNMDQKGDVIEELTKENFKIENVGSGTFNSTIESYFIGARYDTPSTKAFYKKDDGTGGLPADFYAEEYRGKEVYMEYEFVGREVREGDVVSVKYTGYHLDENGNIKLDDKGKEVTFDSGTSSFYIGSHLAIDDFENGLKGALTNVETTFDATFPDDYVDDELKGKKTRFKATVTAIFEVPVYNLQFIKNYFGEYSSVEEFENTIIMSYAKSEMIEYLLANSTIIKYPKNEYKIIKKELEAIDDEYKAENSGISFEQDLISQGSSLDQYIKDQMKTEMIYYAFAQKNNIVPTETEIDDARADLIAYFKEYYMREDSTATDSSAYQVAVSYVDETLGSAYIYEEALYQKIENYLTSNYKVNITDATYESITVKIAKEAAKAEADKK